MSVDSRGTFQRALAVAVALALKMLPGFVDGALVASLRLGDKDSDAMAIGEGDTISISMGVPAWPANMVWARPKGVRAVFFGPSLGTSGLS
ncbi:hypothetical protein HYQ46_013024 [Verticillium longisporum]|nr:hypothetical protein HYQ46_013024 [Verticillium longisporum]